MHNLENNLYVVLFDSMSKKMSRRFQMNIYCKRFKQFKVRQKVSHEDIEKIVI
jgi:hypothetical protein